MNVQVGVHDPPYQIFKYYHGSQGLKFGASEMIGDITEGLHLFQICICTLSNCNLAPHSSVSGKIPHFLMAKRDWSSRKVNLWLHHLFFYLIYHVLRMHFPTFASTHAFFHLCLHKLIMPQMLQKIGSVEYGNAGATEDLHSMHDAVLLVGLSIMK